MKSGIGAEALGLLAAFCAPLPLPPSPYREAA